MAEVKANRFERRKQRTRAALQQAAIELILEKGFDAVQIQDITDRADLGRGTFYVHYDSKEDILWQTLHEEYEALNREIIQQYAGEQSPRLEYLIWIRMFEKAAEQRTLYRVMIGSRGSALLTERIQTYLVGLAEAGIREGRFLPGNTLDPRFVAEYMIGALVRCASWWLEDPADRTPRQMADTFYRQFFHRKPH
jgi:AcrR family transcriptional regulator